MTPTKLHTEYPPPGSFFACRCVVYELDGRKWRCSEREWERFVGTFERKEQRS